MERLQQTQTKGKLSIPGLTGVGFAHRGLPPVSQPHCPAQRHQPCLHVPRGAARGILSLRQVRALDAPSVLSQSSPTCSGTFALCLSAHWLQALDREYSMQYGASLLNLSFPGLWPSWWHWVHFGQLCDWGRATPLGPRALSGSPWGGDSKHLSWSLPAHRALVTRLPHPSRRL